MSRTFKYLFCIVFLSGFTLAQTKDSSVFKLKKKVVFFDVGLSPYPRTNAFSEYGRTPTVKLFPYYKIGFGYNFRVKNQFYFTPKISYIFQEAYFSLSNTNYQPFNYVASTTTNTYVTGGRVTEFYFESYSVKTSFINLDLDFTKLFSPFKNEKMKFLILSGFAVKHGVYQNYTQTYKYERDSLASTYTLLRSDINETKGKRFSAETNFQLMLGSGILLDKKYCQHLFGVKVDINLSDRFFFNRWNKRILFRANYTLNF
ncbi:MAG: hypothetical protein JNJ41_17740 [Bacteroidia bacterium]|nr:hypothetical protein [Bacteroidia bacterium]